MIADLMKRLLGLKGSESISYMEGLLLGPWPAWTLFALLAAAGAWAFWAYRRASRLGKGRRAALATFRLLAVALLLLVLFQPVLRVEYTVQTRDRVIVLVDHSESMSLKDTHASRLEQAKEALRRPVSGVIPQLKEQHDVSLFAFAEGLKDLDPARLESLEAVQATGKATAVGTALEQALDRFGGESIPAAVVLSDFAWNRGSDPVAVAEQLRRRGIAVFPFGLGEPNPPDVAIRALHVKENLFVGDRIPVKIQIVSTPEFAGTPVDLSLSLDKQPLDSRRITLAGGLQFVECTLTAPPTPGRRELAASVTVLPGELSAENNAAARPVNVIDQRIKVLYVEGMPRWEFRYLRAVLLRDPRLEVRFLMTEGDRDLAAHSPYYLDRFPEKGQKGFDFDLVILGDVPSAYFSAPQMEWMSEQVRRRGGALLMIGGSRYAPVTYARTPLAELLPVTVRGGAWADVPAHVGPRPTEDGLQSGLAVLEENGAQNLEVWSRVRPLVRIPPVAAKPGATVLVELSSRAEATEPYPLVAWQRFGSGKSFFVGTEALWRLRLRVGRRYHEEFWARTVQFLTLSRLLGGNDRVRIETDRPSYSAGERVQVFADVQDEFLEPVALERYPVALGREGAEEEAVEVKLTPVPGVRGFYQGSVVPREPGRYQIKAAAKDRSSANTPQFAVEDRSVELANPGYRADTARQMAAISGGELLTPENLPKLGEMIRKRIPERVRREDVELWDSPLLYGILVFVAGMEWFLRRRSRLV
jgi:hypothetical protein